MLFVWRSFTPDTAKNQAHEKEEAADAAGV
jgi:hypothetical protein